jgi:hypothetical protein
MENQTELFKTSDIKSSAYLLCGGLTITKIIKSDAQKVVFCFSDSEKAKKLLQKYWTNEAPVNARTLFENFDYLKGLIHRDYEI